MWLLTPALSTWKAPFVPNLQKQLTDELCHWNVAFWCEIKSHPIWEHVGENSMSSTEKQLTLKATTVRQLHMEKNVLLFIFTHHLPQVLRLFTFWHRLKALAEFTDIKDLLDSTTWLSSCTELFYNSGGTLLRSDDSLWIWELYWGVSKFSGTV